MNENNFEMTKNFWAKEVCRGNLIWPDECVIRFAHKNMQPGATIIDYGCGAGRHSIALAQDGYKMIAIDYNADVLEKVKQRKVNLPVTVMQGDMLQKPDNMCEVDGIVAHGSLFYNEHDIIVRILSNLCDCLKKDGKIWANWRTKKDSLMKGAQLQNNGLYKVYFGEDACSYFFPDEDELKEIYQKSGFEVDAIELFEYTDNNRTKLNSWYHVTAHKL